MKIKEADSLGMMLGTMMQVKGIVGYKIARNLRMIDEELKEYSKIKQELFQKYGEEKDGQLIINKFSENYTKYAQEIKVYEDQDVEFNFKKITEEELEHGDLTVEQILILDKYFGEEQ